MFISEEESLRRLRTEENILNRLGITSSGGELSPVLPLEILLPSESEKFPPALPSDSPSSPKKATKGPINFDVLKEEEAQVALEKLLNPTNYAGRGTKHLHRDTQAGIGITASIIGSTRASRLGDVALSQAHSYESGYTDAPAFGDPTKSPKADLQDRIIAGHGIVVDKCFNRLLKTLDLLDDEKLSKVTRATELSVIAKNMSTIVGHAASVTQDKLVDASEKSVHFHIMRPEQATDGDYPTIDIAASESPDFPVEPKE